MRIKFRFFGVSISGGAGDEELEIAAGATIAEALAVLTSKYDVGFPLKQLLQFIMFVDSQPASPEQVLHDGEELIVMCKIEGG